MHNLIVIVFVNCNQIKNSTFKGKGRKRGILTFSILVINFFKRFNFSDSYNSQKNFWGLRSNPRKKLSLIQCSKLVIVMMPSLNIRVTTSICHWLFKSSKLALRQSWGAFHGKTNRAAANVSSLADCSSIILCFFW